MMKHQQKIVHWQAIFSQQSKSGISIREFCEQHKMSTSTFYLWRKRVANENKTVPPAHKQQLVPLFLEHGAAEHVSSLTLTTPQGFQLVFEETITPNKLSGILSVLA